MIWLADSEVSLVTLCYCPLTRCINDTGVVWVGMIDRWAGRTDVELIVQHHSTVWTQCFYIYIQYLQFIYEKTTDRSTSHNLGSVEKNYCYVHINKLTSNELSATTKEFIFVETDCLSLRHIIVILTDLWDRFVGTGHHSTQEIKCFATSNRYIKTYWLFPNIAFEMVKWLMPTWNLPNADHVHHDLTSPIQARSDTDNTELGKYCRTLSSKTAKLPLLERHLLTAVNQLTLSFLCTL